VSELNENLEVKVRDRTAALNEANQRLEELANTDLLTGLPESPACPHPPDPGLERLPSAGGPLACLLLDVRSLQGHQ
jgi:GGDEF domain-containing protein